MEERAYWLAWSKISGIGPVLLKRVWEHFGSLKTAWYSPERDLGQVEGLKMKLLSTVIQMRSQFDPHKLLQEHLQKNPYFWTPIDPEYPQLLLEIPSPPPLLYYQGQVDLQENQGITPIIGIVGTRYPTEHGKRWTRKISKALAKHGFTVVSGMAAGIDGEAHQACLEAGGRTLAVLGTSVDMVYPYNHRQLHQQIQQQGLILSEYPAGTRPDRGNFPARNRIIAGLSRAILVMEAPEKSGALITARYGNEFGRDLYILPNSPDYRESQGCLRLLHQGADVILDEEELLTSLGAIPKLDRQLPKPTSSKPPTSALFPDLDPESAKIFQCISNEPIPFDNIVQETGLESGTVLSTLLNLELMGLITQLPGMRYQR